MDGHWASSEVYLLVNLFYKSVDNAVRRLFCLYVSDKNSNIASAIAAPLAVVLCTIVVIAVIVFLYKR